MDPQYTEVLKSIITENDRTLSVLLLGDKLVGKKTFITNCCFYGIASIPTKYNNLRLALFPNENALIYAFYPEIGDLDLPTKEKLYPLIDGSLVFFDLTDKSSYSNAMRAFGELIEIGGKMLPVFMIGTKKDIADFYHREVTTQDVLIDMRQLADCSVHRVPYAEIATTHCHGYEEILVDLTTMMLCPYVPWCNDRPAARRKNCTIPEFRSYYEKKLPINL